MPADKKKNKKTDWVKKWCRDNLEVLRAYEGLGVTLGLHKKHGIVMVAINVGAALDQLDFMKDSIAKNVELIGEAKALKLAGHRSALQQISESVEKKSNAWKTDPSAPQPEVALSTDVSPRSYAQANNLKMTEVLMKLLQRGDKDINLHTLLTKEQVNYLDEAFFSKKANNPWSSKDPQPAFTPLNNIGGIRYD